MTDASSRRSAAVASRPRRWTAKVPHDGRGANAMRVAIVSQPVDGVLPPHQNSIGIWSHEVARRLADDAEVTVHGKWARHLREQGIGRRVAQDSVEYCFHLGVPNRVWTKVARAMDRTRTSDPFHASVVNLLDYSLAVSLAVRRSGADVIHIHNFTGFVPVVRMFNRGTPIVLHMACEWLSQLSYRRMDRRIAAVDLVLGCSDHIRDLVRERFPHHAHKCVTAHNGVDPDAFGRQHHEDGGAGLAPGQRLVFVGRLSPEKGVHDLIRAFSLVADNHPGALLEIVGPAGAVARDFIVGISDDELIGSLDQFYEGDYVEQLQALVPTHLGDRVIFRGGLPHAEVADLLRRADVLVNPSYVEAFGMSLVEAMASRLPAVATRTGGMVEIVEDGVTGLLVDRGDVDGLASSIDRLLRDPELRRAMGAAGRRRAEERFSWDTVSATVRSAYGRVTTQLAT